MTTDQIAAARDQIIAWQTVHPSEPHYIEEAAIDAIIKSSIEKALGNKPPLKKLLQTKHTQICPQCGLTFPK